MILGVDIGGTKTLFGIFNSSGEIQKTVRFATPKNYKDFLDSFSEVYKSLDYKISQIVIAVPGRIDKSTDRVLSYGNLPWKNTPLKNDVNGITNLPVSIENDAKLGALSEANQLKPPADKVLYITFSTGIGAGLIYKGKLDEAMLDSEVGQMLLPNPDNNGVLIRWELFASGKALYEKYGQKAEDLTDKESWGEFTKKMAVGIVDLCAVIEPDVLIIGGGVGAHFKKYGKLLEKSVLSILPYMVKKPSIIGAKNAELASLLGCYEYSKLGSKS